MSIASYLTSKPTRRCRFLSTVTSFSLLWFFFGWRQRSIRGILQLYAPGGFLLIRTSQIPRRIHYKHFHLVWTRFTETTFLLSCRIFSIWVIIFSHVTCDLPVLVESFLECSNAFWVFESRHVVTP